MILRTATRQNLSDPAIAPVLEDIFFETSPGLKGINILISGAWKSVKEAFIVVSGQWKKINEVQVINSSVWKNLKN